MQVSFGTSKREGGLTIFVHYGFVINERDMPYMKINIMQWGNITMYTVTGTLINVTA